MDDFSDSAKQAKQMALSNLSPSERAKRMLRMKMWKIMKYGNVSLGYVFNRIPVFAGLDKAVSLLADTDEFKNALHIKVGNDRALTNVQLKVLQVNKYLYVPAPKTSDGIFMYVDLPADVKSHQLQMLLVNEHCNHEGLHLIEWDESIRPLDMIIMGSVVVSTDGKRIGCGNGNSDLHLAFLKELGVLTENTVLVTIVHDLQICYDFLPEGFHKYDMPVDLIVTPTNVIRTSTRLLRPNGIDWENLTFSRLRTEPILLQYYRLLDRSGDKRSLKANACMNPYCCGRRRRYRRSVRDAKSRYLRRHISDLSEETPAKCDTQEVPQELQIENQLQVEKSHLADDNQLQNELKTSELNCVVPNIADGSENTGGSVPKTSENQETPSNTVVSNSTYEYDNTGNSVPKTSENQKSNSTDGSNDIFSSVPKTSKISENKESLSNGVLSKITDEYNNTVNSVGRISKNQQSVSIREVNNRTDEPDTTVNSVPRISENQQFVSNREVSPSTDGSNNTGSNDPKTSENQESVSNQSPSTDGSDNTGSSDPKTSENQIAVSNRLVSNSAIGSINTDIIVPKRIYYPISSRYRSIVDYSIKLCNLSEDLRVRDIKLELLNRTCKPLAISWFTKHRNCYLHYGKHNGAPNTQEEVNKVLTAVNDFLSNLNAGITSYIVFNAYAKFNTKKATTISFLTAPNSTAPIPTAVISTASIITTTTITSAVNAEYPSQFLNNNFNTKEGQQKKKGAKSPPSEDVAEVEVYRTITKLTQS